MVYEVEYTDEFREWYEDGLSASEQEDVARVVEMLEKSGPLLPFPYSSGISGSKFNHMRELRISTRDDRIASCTPSTRAAQDLYC